MKHIQHTAGIILRNKKILLLQRTKDDVEANKWTPINETMEDGESPETAVIRGVKEEVGLDFRITKRLDDYYYNGWTAIFLGNAVGEIEPSEKEVASYGWFSYEEAKTLDFAFGYDKVIHKLKQLQLL